MISDLLALLFHSRDYAHRAHLKTGSYAAHKALETFYTDLPDLIDSITEAYQGRNGPVEIPYVTKPTDGEPAQVLAEHLAIVEGVRYQAVPKTETSLQNLLDEVVALYLSTLYKLKYLK